MNKLYLVVRADLPPGQQAVQAAHASTQFWVDNRERAEHWFTTSNTLALLAAPDARKLHDLLERARMRGIPVSAFYEPDRGNELTAIALAPEARKLVSNLPLALQDRTGVG